MLADRAHADQVRENRQRLRVLTDAVELADLGVAVAVGGVGELDRDERPAVRAVVART